MNNKCILSLILLGSIGTSSLQAIDISAIIGSTLLASSALSGLVAGYEFNKAREKVIYLPPGHPDDANKTLGVTPPKQFKDYYRAMIRRKYKHLGNVVFPRICRKVGYISGGISLASGLLGCCLLKNSLSK